MDEEIPNSACPTKHNMCEARRLFYWEMYRVPAVCLRQCFLVLIVDVVQHCGGSVTVSRLQANVLSHCAPRRTGASILIKLFIIIPSPSLASPSLLSLLSDDDMDNLGMVQLKIVIWKWPVFSNGFLLPLLLNLRYYSPMLGPVFTSLQLAPPQYVSHFNLSFLHLSAFLHKSLLNSNRPGDILH